ncbi:alpha/beta hydrolase [Magnetospirillum molischianum]|uniref:Hydrolase of the alpha/beta superfamily n=1 Tax=Magnetospirillum molischianum DSM 120 TaxID=1150626 RepID=H8FNQ6_MAGML|nr:alpha/beta fold hydrolase [Magnetospirillum molischianum]CCG39994.1 Hydrolase of the alpha/beta superfamily [Magnetospirillum molischianum DSM 120]
MVTALLAAAGGLASLYLLMLLALGLFQRDMIYRPDPTRTDPADIGLSEMLPVPVRVHDGRLITSWYAPPLHPHAPTLVMFHGNAGTNAKRAHKARFLLDAGFGVFMVEYRGYGGNSGQPSEADLTADARAVLEWLAGRGVGSGRLVLCGESIGSGVAMAMTREIEPLAVILECPFTALADLAPPYVPTVLARWLMRDHFDNLTKIAALKAPLLIIHGEQDDLTPPAMARTLVAAAGSADKGAVFLPLAHHNDLWEHGAERPILDFLRRL